MLPRMGKHRFSLIYFRLKLHTKVSPISQEFRGDTWVQFLKESPFVYRTPVYRLKNFTCPESTFRKKETFTGSYRNLLFPSPVLVDLEKILSVRIKG